MLIGPCNKIRHFVRTTAADGARRLGKSVVLFRRRPLFPSPDRSFFFHDRSFSVKHIPVEYGLSARFDNCYGKLTPVIDSNRQGSDGFRFRLTARHRQRLLGIFSSRDLMWLCGGEGSSGWYYDKNITIYICGFLRFYNSFVKNIIGKLLQ